MNPKESRTMIMCGIEISKMEDTGGMSLGVKFNEVISSCKEEQHVAVLINEMLKGLISDECVAEGGCLDIGGLSEYWNLELSVDRIIGKIKHGGYGESWELVREMMLKELEGKAFKKREVVEEDEGKEDGKEEESSIIGIKG
jgi:hypothetical protein